MPKIWFFVLTAHFSALFLPACNGDDSSAISPDAGSDGDADTDIDTDTDTDTDMDADGGADSGNAETPADRVDTYWSDPPDKDTRLMIFDELWSVFAEYYPCFVTANVDWDAARETYRPLIEEAKSYGLFYQLLSEMIFSLSDMHTKISSTKICGNVHLEHTDFFAGRPPIYNEGVPYSAIGACVTPTDEGELVVYSVLPGNPAGLAPGDVIIGYDGRPWSDLLDTIVSWKLPYCGRRAQANSAGESHRLYAVMNNHHLFETLDVERHVSTGPDSVATEGFLTYPSTLVCSDQLPVEGVDVPWTTWKEERFAWTGQGHVTFGVLPGTNIGYIYIYSWTGEVEDKFAAAVAELMETDGLIIDQRFNLGGVPIWNKGMAALFDKDLEHKMVCKWRDPDSNNYDSLKNNESDWTLWDIDVDEDTFYDRPIALLTGPQAISGGDIFPFLMHFHPRVRSFGRPTNAAFGMMNTYWTEDPYLSDIRVTYTMSICTDEVGNYLQASERTPDEEVWLTHEDIIAGVDTVVEAALAWIDEQTTL
ncbi:MAG: hypothetical protein GY854_13190 [Deltaproteobacteria bacterium]|nr:hypothetical protein [Deltaproteobacteria bacterium]